MSRRLARRCGAGAATAAATLALAACGGSGAGAGPGAASPASAGAPPATAPTATATAAPAAAGRPLRVALRDAVLRPADAPAGTTYLAKQSGRMPLTQVVPDGPGAAADRRALQGLGFRGAVRRMFLRPALPASAAKGHMVASYAMVFPSARAARAAARLLDSATAGAGPALRPLPAPAVGRDAVAYRAPLTTLPGDTYYVRWREGNALRALVDAGGTGVVGPQTATTLAQRMAAAAPAGRPFQAGDVARLVLPRSLTPGDTAYVAGRSGPRSARDFGRSAATTQRLRDLGFVRGYGTMALSPELLHPQRPAPGAGAPTNGLVSSQAQRYASPAAAARAFALLVRRERRLVAGHRVRRLRGAGLGAESFGFLSADRPGAGRSQGIGWFWRRGDLVLSLVDVGQAAAATPEEAAALVRRVDRRLG